MSYIRKSIARNMKMTLIYQIVSIMFGFIIPKMILTEYGASLHGLTSTVTNFMNYVLLLNAGLTTAAIQSLYAPLGSKDFIKVNEVYNAINKYYKKTAYVFAFAIFLVSVSLPVLTRNEIDSFFVFFLVLIMGTQHVLDAFLVSSSRALLQADQKMYVTYRINIITYIIRGLLQIALIHFGFSLLLVQLVLPLLVVIRFILIRGYISREYASFDKNIKPNMNSLNKRKYAFIHQISGLVLNNTDVIVLTIFMSQIFVSIYSVYQLVFSYLHGFLYSIFSTSSVASFGNMLATKNAKLLRDKFIDFEIAYFVILSIIYSVALCMIIPFVSLYTSGVEAVEYVDNLLAFLFILSGLLNGIRVPALTLIDAAGLYKETQKSAIIEMTINIVSSLLLVNLFGIYGVLFGTIISFLYRSFEMIIFTNKYILLSKSRNSIKRVGILFLIVASNYIIVDQLNYIKISSWNIWIINSTITVFISALISIFLYSILDRRSMSVFKKTILKNSQ